jgi:hypothetical protein
MNKLANGIYEVPVNMNQQYLITREKKLYLVALYDNYGNILNHLGYARNLKEAQRRVA